MADRSLAHVLATAFLAGEQSFPEIVRRADIALGRKWYWVRPLALRYLERLSGGVRPRHRDVEAFIRRSSGFRLARRKYSSELRVQNWVSEPQRMQPVVAAAAWNLPRIETAGELAGWLGLTASDLDWFADLKGLTAKIGQTKLWHYNYRVLSKQFGSVRIIESPKEQLKAIQRRILREILNHIPPHESAHGFLRGHSIKTFVAPHVGRRVVLRMDLQDFFPSFSGYRVQAFFRTAGYPEQVADLLDGLCTNVVPGAVFQSMRGDMDAALWHELRDLYTRPHLPQGAPTSPALANVCAFHLDCRLSGLARSTGAAYTRYADDLAFSGDEEFEHHVDRFSTHVAAIALEEGFHVHFRKTRVMRQGVRQHLAGVVTNQKPNVRRDDFDRLKAILTNCVRHGPATQNPEGHPDFRAHLDGRISFVEMVNPEKAKNLRALFREIRW